METVLIYVGAVDLSGGKTGHKYYDTVNKSYHLFAKKLLSLGSVGFKIKCKIKGDTFYDQSMDGFVQPNEEEYKLVQEWSIKHRARLERIKAERASKKPHSKSIEETVKSIRESTWQMTSTEKRNFALWVYNEILK